MNDYDRVVALYDAIAERAEDGTYTGSMAKVYDATKSSRNHYRKTFDALLELGAIELVSKGRPSIIRVLEPPTEERFEQIYKSGIGKTLTKRSPDDIVVLGQRVTVLERASAEGRVGEIQLGSVLSGLDRRIKRLEGGTQESG